MSITKTNASDTGTGNGSATVFPFTFCCIDPTQVQVYLDDVLQIAGYTAVTNGTLNGASGGSVTFAVAPANGVVVKIASSPAFTMLTAFGDAGPFNGSTVDLALDTAAIRDLKLLGLVMRAIRAPLGEALGDMPGATARAGKFLGFDAGGNPIVATLSGSDASLRTDLAAVGGAALVGNKQGGVGAATRTAQAKFADLIAPEDYGATNGANDSAAVQAAITAKSQVTPAAAKSYAVKDIALSNVQGINGSGQVFSTVAGATNVFSLADYNPRLSNIYVSSSSNAASGLIRIKASRYAMVHGVVSIDCGPKFMSIVPVDPTTTVVALPNVSNCDAEDITGTGIDMGASVSEGRFSDMHLSGKLTAGPGGNRPMFTTVGWRQNTPVTGGFAVGGHQVCNINLSNFNRGMYLTDAQLTKYTNIIVDDCADYGILLDGACQYLDYADTFVGTTRGIKVMGTCSDIHFNGLRTVFIGAIPPWGSTDFFNGVATFYDLEVRDTAQVRVSNWSGPKRIAVDATAKLIVDGGETYKGRSVANVAAASTAYLNEAGAQATEAIATWIAPFDGYLIRIMAKADAAPGGSLNFTYTARLDGVDTTLTQTINGAATGGLNTWAGVLVPVNKGQKISIKLVTDAGAVATGHQAQVQLVPR